MLFMRYLTAQGNDKPLNGKYFDYFYNSGPQK